MPTSDDEALAGYLAEVRSAPILTRQRELELRRTARAGDAAARTALIEGYLELAAMLALRLAPEWMRPLDAIQEANVVLVRMMEEDDHAVLGAVLPTRLLAHYESLPPPTAAP